MLKKILLFFLLSVFYIKSVCADEINQYFNFGDEITYYYKDKNTDKALLIIKQISDSKILENEPHIFTPTIGFILGIIGEDENALEEIHNLEVSSEMRKCISVAESLLKQYSFDVILSDPDKIQDERGLDLLWGVFSATGNPKIPETIRNFVEKNKISEAPNGEKNRKDIVVLSAIWSLESNAKQHNIVVPYAEFSVQSDNMGQRNIITLYKEAIQKENK